MVFVVVEEQTSVGTIQNRTFEFHTAEVEDLTAQDYENGKLVITRSNKETQTWETVAVFNSGKWIRWYGSNVEIKEL